MAAIDFPASPTPGQIFTAPNGASYQWNNTTGLWLALAGSPPGNPPTGSAGGALAGTYPNPTLAKLMWQMYAETILAAPAVEIRVNVPAACKAFEIEYEIVSSNTAANDTLAVQALQGATIYQTANQHTQQVFGAATSPGAIAYINQQYWQFVIGTYWQGQIKGSLAPGPRADMFFNAVQAQVQSAQRGAEVLACDGGPARNTVTGFRFASVGTVNFAIGSYARALVLM